MIIMIMMMMRMMMMMMITIIIIIIIIITHIYIYIYLLQEGGVVEVHRADAPHTLLAPQALPCCGVLLREFTEGGLVKGG